MHFRFLFLPIFLICVGPVFGQEKVVSRKQFFLDTSVIEVVVRTDIKKLIRQKANPTLQPAKLTWKNADSSGDLQEAVRIRLRGNNRRENCNLASLMLDFRVEGENSRLKNLKEMKWVAPCAKTQDGEQLVLKEYLIYKMYNQLTDKSFRVRLLRVTFEDELEKQKSYTQYGFAIEHVDDLKKRVDCVEEKEKVYAAVQTNYDQTTLVSIFQYMIGNTDWSVPNYHNIKLLIPKDSPQVKPYMVPYDFDYAGAVNAPYAAPDETRPITKVTERYYMGLPRTFEMIKEVTDKFMLERPTFTGMIRDWSLLNNFHKNEMADFIAGFFEILESDKAIKLIFVDFYQPQ
jgi:hypothetical protein